MCTDSSAAVGNIPTGSQEGSTSRCASVVAAGCCQSISAQHLTNERRRKQSGLQTKVLDPRETRKALEAVTLEGGTASYILAGALAGFSSRVCFFIHGRYCHAVQTTTACAVMKEREFWVWRS